MPADGALDYPACWAGPRLDPNTAASSSYNRLLRSEIAGNYGDGDGREMFM
jgi:hypothetical protein